MMHNDSNCPPLDQDPEKQEEKEEEDNSDTDDNSDSPIPVLNSTNVNDQRGDYELIPKSNRNFHYANDDEVSEEKKDDSSESTEEYDQPAAKSIQINKKLPITITR
jgi:hypothetical protein